MTKPVILVLLLVIMLSVSGLAIPAGDVSHIVDTPAITTGSLVIKYPELEVPDMFVEEQHEVFPRYTEEDLFNMACVIYQEAGGDLASDETRLLVGSVVLNRVNHPMFPNTIKGVLEQHKQYGVFYKTGIKFPKRAEHEGEQHAVKRAYVLARQLLEEGSICDASVIWQAEFKQGKGVYAYQDGIYFCF